MIKTYFTIPEVNYEKMQEFTRSAMMRIRKYGLNLTISNDATYYKPHVFSDGSLAYVKYYQVSIDSTASTSEFWAIAIMIHGDVYTIKNLNVDELDFPKNIRGKYHVVVSNDYEYQILSSSEFMQLNDKITPKFFTEISSLFDYLLECEQTDFNFSTAYKYYDLKTYLKYCFECAIKFGYVQTKNGDGLECTRDLAYRIMCRQNIEPVGDSLDKQMQEVGFNANRREIEKLVETALVWLFTSGYDGEYFKKMKTVCSESRILRRDLGFAAALPITYLKHTQKDFKVPENLPKVGSKVKVKIDASRLENTLTTKYGISYVYRFTDTCGNNYKTFLKNKIDTDGLKELSGEIRKYQSFYGLAIALLVNVSFNNDSDSTMQVELIDEESLMDDNFDNIFMEEC